MTKNNMGPWLSTISIVALSASINIGAIAQEAERASNDVIEEVVSIGTRSNKPRTVTDSPVPVDVFSEDEFNAAGNTADITDKLRNLVPSYTATPATGDGSAFVRPTSLRGMSSDQTLVMINGKRRHRSALVQFLAPAAGNGAHGPDVGMIPSIAIKSVEVLRDGAAAQYGSDAIAGVINFNLKDASEGGTIVGQWGQYYKGERSYKIAGNVGLPVGDTGFLNVSFEYVDNEALSRGIQRADAQALIDSGVSGVGADSPFGDAPFVQSWGRPETSGFKAFVNSGMQIADNADFYFHGNYADTDGRYRFFFRHPTTHSSLIPLRDMGYTGLPAGFTPFLDGAQQDTSAVAGVKGDMEGDIFYDFSIGFGENKLDYFLNNTVNPDLGLVNGQIPKMDFDVGAYEQKELNVNADFSKALNETFNLGFGGEWRKETYTVVAGEPDSYLGGGSSGLKGFTPADAGAYSRNNYGVYIDLEQDVNEDLLLQYAGRFENYSDFGGTLNGKFAVRYNVSDTFTLRGAASTGFHAPTPGQANVRTTITTFDGVTGNQVEEGLLPPTSEQAMSVGGTALKEETSVNYSLGFASFLSENTTLTMDLYQATVNDRIYKTGDIPLPGSTTGATVAFYTNALDIRHKGIDLVLTSTAEFDNDASMDISLAANYNKVNVLRQNQVGGINPVSAGNIEDIENNFPKFRFVLSSNTSFAERWNFMARVNYYGSHYDERGTIGAATSPSYKIGSTFYVDMELGFQVNDDLRLVAGGVNVFNSFVDEIADPWANRVSVGLQYPRRSAANYEGGSWYLRAQYSF